MQDFLVPRTRYHARCVAAEQRMKKEWEGNCHGAIQVMLMPTAMLVVILQILSAAPPRKLIFNLRFGNENLRSRIPNVPTRSSSHAHTYPNLSFIQMTPHRNSSPSHRIRCSFPLTTTSSMSLMASIDLS